MEPVCWKRNQTTSEKPSEEEENQEGTTLDLVFRTMRGEFGNGEERKAGLEPDMEKCRG